MGMLEICSSNSYWRGLDYFQNNKVKTINQTSRYEYDADVQGTELYHVHLDINHPKKSTCTCPHASGKSIICKHKVAAYFAAFPEEAQEAVGKMNRYYEEQEKLEKERKKRLKERKKQIKEYVKSLSEAKAKKLLLDYMIEEAARYHYDSIDDDDRW